MSLTAPILTKGLRPFTVSLNHLADPSWPPRLRTPAYHFVDGNSVRGPTGPSSGHFIGTWPIRARLSSDKQPERPIIRLGSGALHRGKGTLALPAGNCSLKKPDLLILRLNQGFIRDTCVAALAEAQSSSAYISQVCSQSIHSFTYYLPRDSFSVHEHSMAPTD